PRPGSDPDLIAELVDDASHGNDSCPAPLRRHRDDRSADHREPLDHLDADDDDRPVALPVAAGRTPGGRRTTARAAVVTRERREPRPRDRGRDCAPRGCGHGCERDAPEAPDHTRLRTVTALPKMVTSAGSYSSGDRRGFAGSSTTCLPLRV